MGKDYEYYEDVPWYRRSGTASIFVLCGFCLLPPLLWTVCVICLTGDIYNNKLDRDGYLTKWSSGNKVAAVIILVLQTIVWIVRFTGAMDDFH